MELWSAKGLGAEYLGAKGYADERTCQGITVVKIRVSGIGDRELPGPCVESYAIGPDSSKRSTE
jgi:hypothetical protein